MNTHQHQMLPFDAQRWSRVQAAIETRYGVVGSAHVGNLIGRLVDTEVQNLGTYVRKLQRSLAQVPEFNATLREGVYAWRFAQQSAHVCIEPHGGKGPDLGLAIEDASINVEIKRLTEGNADRGDPVEDWYADETDPSARPASREWVTAKVADVVREASTQLRRAEHNAIVLADFSVTVGRQNFSHAMEDLADEIHRNGTYGHINLVQYDSNSSLSAVNTYIWVNERADLALPPRILRFFAESAAGRTPSRPVKMLMANEKGLSP